MWLCDSRFTQARHSSVCCEGKEHVFSSKFNIIFYLTLNVYKQLTNVPSLFPVAKIGVSNANCDYPHATIQVNNKWYLTAV